MNVNLVRTLKDNNNSAEVKRNKAMLNKVKIAYRYNREQFINKINKLRKGSLIEMKNRLIKQRNDNAGDKDAIKIIEGQIAEIDKLL